MPAGATDQQAAGDIPRVVHLPVFPSEDGILGVAEFSDTIGFTPRRFYFITDVPAGSVRGGHAHKTLRQCMMPLQGALTVDLEQGGRRSSFRLDSRDQCLLIPPGCWRVMRDFATRETVLGVLAAAPFDEGDYIYDYGEFRRWEAAQSRPAVVPYLDLARPAPEATLEIDAALLRVQRSGRYIGGPEVDAFEAAFAAYCGAAAAVGVGNGLDALTLALQARGIGVGQSVLVPAN